MERQLEVWWAGGIVATIIVPANPGPGDVPVLSGIPLEVTHLIQQFAFGFGDTRHHRGYRWLWSTPEKSTN